jgi:hypothetical protein
MPKQLPAEALLDLRRQLSTVPPRSAERRQLIQATADFYGLSEYTLYKTLRERWKPRTVRRRDHGQPRAIPRDELERYCEIIAALKLRTSSGKGRHLSTREAIRLLECYGVDTPEGHVQAPPTLLNKTTINRYLKKWGYDYTTLLKQPPAVRFQAQHSNECWHFDLSPSDLKHLPNPPAVHEGRGNPLLMLYSVVDDRSGVAYQECWRICHLRASAQCAVGSGFAPLLGHRKSAKWAEMPGFPLKASHTRSIRIWPVKP